MSRLAIWLAACAVVGAMGGFLTSPPSSTGHTQSTYYAHKWTGDRYWNVGYLQSALNNSTAIGTINRGPVAWSSVADAWFDFIGYAGRDANRTWTGSACTTAAADRVLVVSYNISNLGEAHSCIFTGDHFPSTDAACTGTFFHTMCSGLSKGSAIKRTLETHDTHTFTAAY